GEGSGGKGGVDGKGEKTPEPPKSKGATAAAKRLDEEKARLKHEKAVLEQQFEELKKSHLERETKLTELQTLLEERERKLKETEEWYRNEASEIHIDPMEIPEVRNATQEVFTHLESLIPMDISAEDES